MPRKRKKQAKSPPAALLISENIREQYFFLPATVVLAAYAYYSTLCPTIFVGDSGELTTAAYHLGIPHSPGYPLYCLIGWVFTHIPFSPDIAYRLNLMSAFFSLATVVVLYLIIYHFTRTPYLSFTISLAYAFSPIFWSQAVVAEVYGLNTFLTALALYFLCRWLEKRTDRWLYLAFFIMGLATTNHQLSFLLLPTGIYFIWLFNKGLSKPLKFWIILGLLYFAGTLVYLYLPIRASADPPINWGDPDNFSDFMKTVFSPAGAQVSHGSRIIHFLHVLVLWTIQFSPVIHIHDQTVPIPIIWFFGLWGIYKGISTGWRMARVFILFMLLNVGSIIFVSRPTQEELIIVGVYYLPVFLVYAVFMATGIREWLQIFLNSLTEKKRPLLHALIILVLVLIPEYQYFQNRQSADRSNNYYARDYGTALLANCPPNSLLLVNWDDIFTIWYLQKVEGYRTDVIPVLADFPMDSQSTYWGRWYFEELKEKHPTIFAGTGLGTSPFISGEDAINAFMVANLKRGKPVYTSFYGLGYDFRVLSPKVFPIGPVYRVGWEPYTLPDVVVAQEKWITLARVFRNLYEYHKFQNDEQDFIISRLSMNLWNTGQVALNIDKDRARWFFEQAVKIHPGNLPATIALAGLYIESQNFDLALDLLLRAKKLEPRNTDIRWFLALLYDHLGKKDLQIEELSQILMIDPGHPEARTQMEQLRKTKQIP